MAVYAQEQPVRTQREHTQSLTKIYPITERTTETEKDEENRYLSEDRKMENIQKCSEFVPEKRELG